MSDIDFTGWVIGFAGVHTVIGKVVAPGLPEGGYPDAVSRPVPGEDPRITRIVLSPVFTLQTRLGKTESPIHPGKEMAFVERTCVPFLHYFAIERLSIPNVSLVKVTDLTERDQHELSEAIRIAELMTKDMRRHDALHAVTVPAS